METIFGFFKKFIILLVVYGAVSMTHLQWTHHKQSKADGLEKCQPVCRTNPVLSYKDGVCSCDLKVQNFKIN
jgi:hypothetical protein